MVVECDNDKRIDGILIILGFETLHQAHALD